MVGPITNTGVNTTFRNTETPSVTTGNVPGTGMGSGGTVGALPPPPPLPSDYSGNAGLPEDPGQAADDLETALERFRNDPELREKLLSALGSGGGAEEIAALMIKFSNLGRENALDQRLQAREAAKADLMASASESREAASKQIAAAIVGFVVSVVSAVVSLAGSISSAKNAVSALKETKEANQMEKLAKIAESSGDKSAPRLTEAAKNAGASAQAATLATQRSADIGRALSQLAGGLGQLVSGVLEGAAKIDEAEGKEFEAEATDQQAQADIGKKIMDDIEEMVKAAIQFLKAMQSAEVDLMASMTRV